MSLKGAGFVLNRIGIQNFASSSAHIDGRIVNLDFLGRKYTPFEGAGADLTRWNLSVPEITGSDIEDITITICYTARIGKEGVN